MDLKISSKIIKDKGVFVFEFLFQPNWTQNKEMGSKKKNASFVTVMDSQLMNLYQTIHNHAGL
jgi:competence protein ComGC